jgi:PPOX class probable F420-dependent enzyme
MVALQDETYILFTTFRRDGTPVPTPVWVVPLDEGRLGFTTSSSSGKAKRLAHTPEVTVQPCNGRGRPRAGTEVVEATAEMVTGERLDEIVRGLRAKYGIQTRLVKLGHKVADLVRRRSSAGDCGVVITLTSV